MKIALIGHRGHWGYVLKDLARLPEVEVVAISGGGDPVEPMAEALRKYYSGPFALYEDYRLMLAEVPCDLVMVDGPFHQHAEMCVECLKYNRHVFCEKPIALTLEDLEKIEEAYDKAEPGTRIASMVGLRTEPAFHAAYRAVSSGAIGKVQMVNARKSYKLGQRRDFFKKRETYGGTIPWVGSHALDWILWFSGAPYKTIGAFHNSAENRDHGDLEMTCAVMSVMENGVIGTASIDYWRPQGAATHGDDQVRVAGTDGVIEVAHGKCTLITGSGEKEIELTENVGIFRDFVRSIIDGTPGIVSSEETFELTRACLIARDDADMNLQEEDLKEE